MHNVWWYNVTCLEGGETKETDQDHRRHGQEEPVGGWGSSQHVGVDFFLLLLLLQQSDWWRWPDLAFCLLPISKSKCRQRNNNNQQQQRLEIWALLNILECVEQKMSSSQRRRRNQLIQSSQSLNLVCVHTKPSLNFYLYTTNNPSAWWVLFFFSLPLLACRSNSVHCATAAAAAWACQQTKTHGKENARVWQVDAPARSPSRDFVASL